MVICFAIAKDRRHWRRKNGWSLPLHPLQVLAWLFIVMFAVLYFGILVPSLPSGAWQISAYVINSIVFVLHIIIHLISISLDPADINVRAKLNKGPLPSFDRKKHSHVIENQYCNICEVKVGNRSKHCSACNKCVSEFDHHCKWLNNCVGGRNYRLFLSCITSAFIGCLLIFTLSLALIIAFFDSASWLYALPLSKGSKVEGSSNISSNSSNIPVTPTTYIPLQAATNVTSNSAATGSYFVAFVPVNSFVWLIIVICTAVLSFLGIALLGHLLGFHIFLMCQKFSTYDYIVQKRDSDSSSSSNNNQNQPGSKFIRLPFRLLQQMKTKKANQITPGGKGGVKSDQVEELELQRDPCQRPGGKNPVLPVVASQHEYVAEDKKKELLLENYVGNVYIGSPHRRRHYLEPLHVRPKSSPLEIENTGKKESESSKEVASVQVIENERGDTTSVESDTRDETKDAVQSHTYSHGLARRVLRSPTPAPLLSPILESEISQGSAIVSWKHRSVSEQSLHMLPDDDDDDDNDEETPSVGSTPVKYENQGSENILSRENSGSLSNLFVSYKDQTEVIIENNNNNCPEVPEVDDDNKVHEVHIIPQGSFTGFKDSSPCKENTCVNESNDPFINGELWAYAPRNGCHIPGGIMSFRRSCSMQDECVKNTLQNHLTRCRSEDEIKSNQRIVRLQRRLSEDQNASWLVQESDNKLSKKLKECSPKSGISATAVFCVEEPDDPYSIPNAVYSNKRKYSHFTVPSHMVLPCTNSIHPESRKRTRAVGSKPPKAFHA